MSAVVCSACGGAMRAERVTMADGRRRFTLTCDACWESPIVEYSRRRPVHAWFGGEFFLVGYINAPAEATA